MRPLNKFVAASTSVLFFTAALVSTAANAGWSGSPFTLGVGSNSNGWGVNLHPDHFGRQYWGMAPQQNVGIGPGIVFWGIGSQQNVGFNPHYSFGFPGSNFGPFSWGMNPQPNVGMMPMPNGHVVVGWGINPQQSFGLINPYLAAAYTNAAMSSPNHPMNWQAPSQAQGSAQPVQCSINNVAALTKSVDDCEKAGGDVPGAKTADANK